MCVEVGHIKEVVLKAKYKKTLDMMSVWVAIGLFQIMSSLTFWIYRWSVLMCPVMGNVNNARGRVEIMLTWSPKGWKKSVKGTAALTERLFPLQREEAVCGLVAYCTSMVLYGSKIRIPTADDLH